MSVLKPSSLSNHTSLYDYVEAKEYIAYLFGGELPEGWDEWLFTTAFIKNDSVRPIGEFLLDENGPYDDIIRLFIQEFGKAYFSFYW